MKVSINGPAGGATSDCDLEEGLGTVSLILEVLACRIQFPVIRCTLTGDGSRVRTRTPGENPGGVQLLQLNLGPLGRPGPCRRHHGDPPVPTSNIV